ncbi:hypothetical protein E4U60_007065 [Claviceps pazoutovae]|uniref:Helitron helicase-like domain-containing protein n=1 Tax=Claviceps pazoutovae TaxID=1649127 RepID=A0A9P7SHS7_9HYPO|nr:hypothetical protein E4U60_007065 [Claviceps pazoutovae]
MPAIRSTPISDIGVKTRILSRAYPSLYPWGKGDFATSRQRTVDIKPYVQHMLRLSHGGFARHPMWHHTCFDMLMRTQTANISTYFFKKDNSVPLTVPESRDTINSDGPESKELMSSIICFSSTIAGTRAYWTAKRGQLDAMVRTLGCPALFLTFSAADLHWQDLARLMPRYDEWCSASDAGKTRIARENLKNRSHIAASYSGRSDKPFGSRSVFY